MRFDILCSCGIKMQSLGSVPQHDETGKVDLNNPIPAFNLYGCPKCSDCAATDPTILLRTYFYKFQNRPQTWQEWYSLQAKGVFLKPTGY